jgi:NTP pyrophosphatase (non-canonical NTP hydrolase)
VADPFRLIAEEAAAAERRYGPFASAHEALGVLLEEVQELAEAVRGRSAEAVGREACQVAAVATRLAGQCFDPTEEFAERSRLS